ncbi:two-component sensor histidine kinase [Paenibacillus sp. CCS19]|uniref:sensor histidine kinase n=1 Tax=Paenibacillus sp. CCS19 TaxID=3158387 RepID=UPI0025637422|nr:histidine kinase dimerization/phospho-acceptor domain-containing protein [Paenibacillus cellulosilyticus]GMK39498.1 two-component sensor histidine kinase [Paenibacillus cellulosilyticus]
MDTKWKNRTLFALCAFMLVIGLSGPLVFFDQGSRYLHRDYYRTADFTRQLKQFAFFLNLYELNPISKQQAKSSITITEDEIMSYRGQQAPLADQLNALRSEYEPLIQNAIESKNDKVAGYYKDKLELEQQNLMKLYEDDEYVTALIRKDKEQQVDSYYEYEENSRSEFNYLRDQFDYYFRNVSTGEAHTSLSAQNEYTAVNQLNGDGYSYATEYRTDANHYIYSWIQGFEEADASNVPHRGWIAVPKTSALQESADKYRREQILLFAYCLLSATLLVLCFLRMRKWLVVRTERERLTTNYLRIPVDMRMLLLAASSVLTIALIAQLADRFISFIDAPMVYGGTLLSIIAFATIGMMLTIVQGQLFTNPLSNWRAVREEWTRSLLMRGVIRTKAIFTIALNQVKDSFIYRNTGIRLLVFAFIMIGLGFIEGFSASVVQYGDPSIFLFTPILVIAIIAALLLFNKQIAYLNRVAQAADELVAGRTPSELPLTGNGVVAALASNINALRRGFRTLQNEQAKSERLKTELITNVSHDLRTPLTSIITYVGLLKSEDATAEERTAYVNIIDQKSKRLKTMIDDLFEVSTMASGNAKLTQAKTDLVQLMQQSLAEYKEAMDSSDVQFRISLPEQPIYVLADGQKLWRAFDNLIGNMVKYSLSHTRAYITMQVIEPRRVTITFKNVSKYEIVDHADELFERFKRGDASRHTEGSGLGLAIAKSIVDLHEGQLILETDGDLFKASIILSLQEEAAIA